jgi:hypothetical protein
MTLDLPACSHGVTFETHPFSNKIVQIENGAAPSLENRKWRGRDVQRIVVCRPLEFSGEEL